jgi:murein DD-endopeptidase MepM/ murein hydrolase activator NlpD
MKHLVPGYGDIENNSYVIKLNQYVNDLEEKINTQDQYNQSLKRIILEHDTSDIVNIHTASSKTILKSTNKQKSNSISTPVIIDFTSPVEGKINKKIDIKSGHYGVDIASNKDAVIKSIADGIVVFSDWSTETGNTIIIQHPNGILSVYKHNSSLFKEIGDFIKQDEAIGTIGNTGTLTDGPHLHFELWYKGIPLNPLNYIQLD